MIKTIRMSLIAVGVLALGGTAYAGLAAANHGIGGKRTTAAADSRPRLTVSGHVRGLYPGHWQRMRLTLRNHSGRRVAVRSIKTNVRSARAGCSGDDLFVTPKRLRHRRIGPHGTRHRGYRRIGPHGTRHVSVRVRMDKDTPAACEGARWPLRYLAKTRVLRAGR